MASDGELLLWVSYCFSEMSLPVLLLMHDLHKNGRSTDRFESLLHVVNNFGSVVLYIKLKFYLSEGLRGAVAFAQSLHLPLANKMAQKMIMTTTLSITVFTNVILGGFTLPLVKVRFLGISF